MIFKFNFSNIMVLFIFVGIILVVYQYAQSSVQCNGPKIVYKYIPRDFNLDSTLPDGVSTTFKDMFREPTPYVVNLGNENKRNIV